jgi:hypothetical protein
MPLQDTRTGNWAQPQQREKKKLGRRQEAPVEAEVLLAELVAETVRTVARVLDVGGAVQFGSTRDRSAILIRAWCAGDVYEDYCKSVSELIATLEALDDVVEGAKSRVPAPFNGKAVRGS